MRCQHLRASCGLEGNIRPHAVGSLSVEMLLDFSAACPSVLVRWIFVVLKWIDAPTQFINVVKSMCRNVVAYSACQNNTRGVTCSRGWILSVGGFAPGGIILG